MSAPPDIDFTAAHRYFSANCFNACWKLLNAPERTADEDEELIALGHTSFWHWRQRADCTAKNLSVARWMLARIYSVLGRAELARGHAAACYELARSPEVAPFYRGAAHEAIARAAHVAGDTALCDQHWALARAIADTLEPDERKVLLEDLESIPRG